MLGSTVDTFFYDGVDSDPEVFSLRSHVEWRSVLSRCSTFQSWYAMLTPENLEITSTSFAWLAVVMAGQCAGTGPCRLVSVIDAATQYFVAIHIALLQHVSKTTTTTTQRHNDPLSSPPPPTHPPTHPPPLPPPTHPHTTHNAQRTTHNAQRTTHNNNNNNNTPPRHG